jgi:hypothetical protein
MASEVLRVGLGLNDEQPMAQHSRGKKVSNNCDRREL